MTIRASILAFMIVELGAVMAICMAGPPAGFYDSVDTTNAATLRATLHEVIDDHTRFPYTSGSTDTWDILESAQENPNNTGHVIDVYRNRSYNKIGGGTGPYNREHTWPRSYGFPNDGADNYPFTDCYQLYLSDSGYNSSRSNKPYRNCNAGCTEEPTDANNGQGGGTGVYPGNSNWTSGQFTEGTWEVWSGRRGDIARAMFYMDVRYEGGMHSVTSVNEPDLILTDSEALIDASRTGNNELVAYMGMLSVLVQWHQEDPVDDWERDRNDVVASFQGNRNPFIDHPEWVECIFQSSCSMNPDPPPAAPTGLSLVAGDGQISLDWNDNIETDLDGYHVYRTTSIGGPFTMQNAALLTASDYLDTAVQNGTTYFYFATAIDLADQESASSVVESATPGGGNPPSDDPWINEFHYDNIGGDTGEFVEIAGPAGLDLSGWSVIGYNGNGGGSYKTVSLAGIIPDQGGCFGTLAFDFSSMQNGAPDGLALVDPSDVVIEFLSYEGDLTATNGPADGMLSLDIGVDESPAPPIGDSLQLSGTGAAAADFSWQEPGPQTPGMPNNGQTFDGCTQQDMTPPAPPIALTALPAPGQVQLDWADNVEADLVGYRIYRATVMGEPYVQIDGTISTSDYVDDTVNACIEYFYVVTAVDDSGNESGDSNEAAAYGTSGGLPIDDCDSNSVPDECQVDGDADGVIDACDGCPADINKIAPGVCGCGVSDVDSDSDGTPDCNDGCPNDVNKTDPGLCGCGVSDVDSDSDGTPDCTDGCPNDVNKTVPGVCGCGVSEVDSDSDGVPDCNDGCPNDVNKTDPGVCGCGVSDVDSDLDGTPDCNDGCPNDMSKIVPGVCGCGVSDMDSDLDGTPDCNDSCPDDPAKVAPGRCGCGAVDTPADGDLNSDGTVDGRDVQAFVDAVQTGGDIDAICHGDFDEDGQIGVGDVGGLVSALISQ